MADLLWLAAISNPHSRCRCASYLIGAIRVSKRLAGFVYTIFSFAKSIADYVAFVIPFYDEAAIGFVIYLAFFGGAKLAYSTVLQPLIKKHEAVIDEHLQAAAAKAEGTLKGAGAVFVSHDKGKAE